MLSFEAHENVKCVCIRCVHEFFFLTSLHAFSVALLKSNEEDSTRVKVKEEKKKSFE